MTEIVVRSEDKLSYLDELLRNYDFRSGDNGLREFITLLALNKEDILKRFRFVSDARNSNKGIVLNIYNRDVKYILYNCGKVVTNIKDYKGISRPFKINDFVNRSEGEIYISINGNNDVLIPMYLNLLEENLYEIDKYSDEINENKRNVLELAYRIVQKNGIDLQIEKSLIDKDRELFLECGKLMRLIKYNSLDG